MTALFIAVLLSADPTLARVEVQVDGTTREALAWIPAATKEKPAPVVFAFHGHGGNMRQASRTFGFEKVWPEAVVVYMQGLNTVTPRDPKGEKPGWQNMPGLNGDRDLKAFDAMLDFVKSKTAVDEKRIYATGHSNGGGFTYCLWWARPDLFAAVAPSSANPPLAIDTMKPIPLFHVSGKADNVVPFDNQVKTVESVKKINGSKGEGTDWAKDCKLFASDKGAPLVWMVHEGTHKYAEEAPALIVRFFKENPKRTAQSSDQLGVSATVPPCATTP